MSFRTSGFFGALISISALSQYAFGFTCDTTQAVKDDSGAESEVYLADCRIETKESVPFTLSPGERAVLTAEQEIRLGPGFHAKKGSHFQTHFRACIRNPEPGTGYASWGNYGLSSGHPNEMWMKRVAERFVENFGGRQDEQLSVALNYERELDSYGLSIPDFYMDYTDPSSGAHVGLDGATRQGEDSLTNESFTVQGIDKGVFFFHVGHGKPNDFDVRNGDGTLAPTSLEPLIQGGTTTDMDFQSHMRLGNCNSNSGVDGELRYLWLCSCRAFAHGPSIDGYWELKEFQNMDVETRIISTESRYVWHDTRDQYDRPSEYDGSADSVTQRNVIERWGPVLSENFRIACGISTSATCSGSTETNHKTMDRLAQNYFDDEMSVADSWGYAFEPYWSDRDWLDSSRNFLREVRQVPVCIARGNLPQGPDGEFRSPILDDQRFTNKANPYKDSWHIVSWEVEDGVLEAKEQIIVPKELPVLYTEKKLPEWLTGYRKISDEAGFLKVKMPYGDARVKEGMLVSQTLTKDGRPTMKFDTGTGAIILSGERKPLFNNTSSGVLTMKEYRDKANNFIESQGWSEQGMGDLKGIKGMLQVIPVKSGGKDSAIIKALKDITFFARRTITVDGQTVKVLGSDNQIAVHINNDGTVKSASKRWRKIKEKTAAIAVMGYQEAYAKSQEKLSHSGMYKLAGWDWGYKSTTDRKGRDLMAIHYTFSFDPVSIIDECVSQSMVVDVKAQDI